MTPFTICASFEASGVKASWDPDGNFLGYNIDSTSIIENHQDKLIQSPEKVKSRKRNNLEARENYFINYKQMNENKYGIKICLSLTKNYK